MSMRDADPFTRALRFGSEFVGLALLLAALYGWSAWTSVAARIGRRRSGEEVGL